MSTARLVSIVFVGALALGLTACVPDAGFLQGGGGAGAPGATTPADAAASPGAEDDAARADADPARCLLGAWRADNDFFLAGIRQFGDEVTGVTGQVTVTFAEFRSTEAAVSMRDTMIGSTIVMSGEGLEMAVEPVKAAYTDAPYTCDATAATVTTPDGAMRLHRV